MPLSQIVSASIEDGAVAPVDLSSVAQYYGFKNRIINGAMVIDQRNNGASGTAIGYTVDRWIYNSNQSSKGTWQQNAGSVTPPAGFKNYWGFTSSSAYSALSSDYFQLLQPIEGLNIYDLAWGTASAATVTLSFWVRSSLTGTFSGALRNATPDRSYPFTYTISSANTWEQKSVTIPGDTSGTWLTTNSIGIYVNLSLGMGSSFSGTANTWQAGNYAAATGTVSVVGTSGATIYITGVQLEKGTTATSFDYRPFTTEVQLCQRYYEIVDVLFFTLGWASVANQAFWKVTKRTSPTLTNAPNGGSGGTYLNFPSGAAFGSQCNQIFQGAANSTASGGYVIGSAEL